MPVDVSKAVPVLAALGPSARLALVTADGVTWTAAIVNDGQPAYAYSAAAADPETAIGGLLTAVGAQVATVVKAATAQATAIAAAGVVVAIPIGAAQPDQPANSLDLDPQP